jgi:hypothetical protein
MGAYFSTFEAFNPETTRTLSDYKSVNNLQSRNSHMAQQNETVTPYLKKKLDIVNSSKLYNYLEKAISNKY